MTFGKLYGPIDNPRVQKSLLVAEFNGISLETIPDFNLMVDSKSPEFISKFPLRQCPAFEDADGFKLTESAAIAFHFAQSKDDTILLGATKQELAKIWQLVLFAESSLMQPIVGILVPRYFKTPIDPEVEKKHYDELNRYLAYFNDFIADKAYLVGNNVTLADINLIGNLIPAFKYLITPELKAKHPNVVRYFDALLALPEFKKVIGEVTFKQSVNLK